VTELAGPAIGAASPASITRRRAERLVVVRAAMEDAGYDALVVAGRGIISQYGYLEYVSGYCPVVRSAYAVLGAEGDAALVVATAADAWYARRRAGLEDVRVAGQGDVYSEYDDLAAGVASALAEHGADHGVVGVVGLRHIVPVGDHELLRSRLPNARLADATALLAAVKAIKDDAEIEEVRLTAAVADAGFTVGLEALRAGTVAREVCGAIEQTVRSRGARGEVLIFLSADAYFLERPAEHRFTAGELVTAYVELTGATGYWVELAGLIAVGTLDGTRATLAAATLEAARSAEEALRAGRTAGDVAAAIDEHVARHALRSGIWHGHGVGVDHDLPVVTAADRTPLAERMVIAVHPNFSTADETLGASVADTYVVRDGAPERLSRIPRELHRR
jgi:Xaa-Pro aminopeptidase